MQTRYASVAHQQFVVCTVTIHRTLFRRGHVCDHGVPDLTYCSCSLLWNRKVNIAQLSFVVHSVNTRCQKFHILWRSTQFLKKERALNDGRYHDRCSDIFWSSDAQADDLTVVTCFTGIKFTLNVIVAVHTDVMC